MIDLIIWPMLWLFLAFVFVVKVKHRVEGTWMEMPARYLLVYPFVIFDFFVNLIPMSILMLELPPHIELVTARMKRYKAYGNKGYSNLKMVEIWRLWFAETLCKLLNQHDKNHC